MKTDANKFAPGSASERQARKKKRMLIALAGITLLTWSRSLIGGDAEPAAKTAALVTPTGAAAPAAGARASVKAIHTFEQASERMKTWPAALERRSLEGAIADLTTAYWTNALGTTAVSVPGVPAKTIAREEQPATPSSSSVESEAPDRLSLKLRSTALLGNHRFAVIGNTRYSEGARFHVPGVGEVLLESVRSREAVLRKGPRTWTLTIENVSNSEGV